MLELKLRNKECIPFSHTLFAKRNNRIRLMRLLARLSNNKTLISTPENRIMIFIILLASSSAFCQKLEYVYLDRQDSSINNYAILLPESKTDKGWLVIMPGMNESPQNVLTQTDLPREAVRQGLITFVPTLSIGNGTLGVNPQSQAAFDSMIVYWTRRYDLKNKKLYLGGFSAGGTFVLKYAQRSSSNTQLVKPQAVFAIDPPLDFERLHKALSRNIRLNNENPPKAALTLVQKIEDEFGGAPQDILPYYQTTSVFSFSDTRQRGVSALTKMPLRIIVDPDIDFILRQYRHDLYSMNTLDCAGMINELNRLGNENALLIISKERGASTPGGIRSTHTWSIANPVETINWLLKF